MASQALDRFRTKGGLSEAFIEKRGKGAVIAYGRYPSSDDSHAQADLQRIRRTQVDGGYPFADSFLAPPASEALHGSNAEFDLRNAKKVHGTKRAAFTLQIGVYARPDRKPPSTDELAEFRRAAEKAATDLRHDGELAFYYHGPNSSSVTVGVFSAEDIDARSTAGISQALRDAKTKHPYNLVNGQGVNEKTGTSPSGKPVYRMQPSMVVATPD